MIQRIQQSFARQSLMAHFDAQLDHVAEGMVSVVAPLTETVLQQQGFAHAGLTFALGDTAAGYAAMTLLPDTQEVVTSELKINLLAPGKGQDLIARGRVIKPGKRLIVVASDVYSRDAGTETHIATLMGTIVPVPA